MFTRSFSLTLAVALIASGVLTNLVLTNSALAVEGVRLVATKQDEARKLPEDNAAYFSRSDRRVRFELVKLSGGSAEMLAGTKVTVIDPTGEKSTVTADASGVATLDDAKPGLHAVVVAASQGHTAVPIALREADDSLVDSSRAVKLPLVDINPKEVARLASSYLSPSSGSAYDEIDSDFVSAGEITQGFQYRVRLGDDGTLEGQVYTLLRDGMSLAGVEGTNLLIYKGNQLVGRTTANQVGRFSIPGMGPGIYGLIGAGPAGYAAFAFEAYDAIAIASSISETDRETLVSTNADSTALVSAAAAPGSILPVMLIPPPMVPGVTSEIQAAALAYGADGGLADGGFSSPVPGVGQAPLGSTPGGGVGGAGPGGAVGGGFGGGGALGGGGGIGGLGALAGLAAVGAIAADNNDNNNNDFTPAPVATNGAL